MSKWDKLLERILSGAADADIGFDDLCHLLRRLGFAERVNGSHRVFTHPALDRPLVIQPKRDGKAKSYQVEQARRAFQDIKEWDVA